ncbi:MAG: hypothetical protein JO015_16950 [Verrucomicrobia bacterium]|nr:hypothetical protein [Verrucomicrobiota bacterium]
MKLAFCQTRIRCSVAAAAVLLVASLAGCAGLGDSYVANDCLIVAAKAQFSLPPSTWNRLLVVRYGQSSLQHVYLVYSRGDGMLTAFDSAYGTRQIATTERDADRLARLVDPLARSGWFVEDNAGNRHLAAN